MIAGKKSTGKKSGMPDRVRLEGFGGRLRLRWSANGRRHCLSLGMEDTKSNRLVAQKIILQIEADLESGQFVDAAQYKVKSASLEKLKLTVLGLFDKWLKYKATHVSQRTIDWYRDTAKNLTAYFEGRSAVEVDRETAIGFFTWLKSQPLKPETQQRRLEAIASAWKWAVEENLIGSSNPWAKIPKLVTVPDIEGANPFTEEECEKILEAIGEIRPRSCYVAFVRFMFGCGTRPGEAIGLRWGDISENFSKVTIRSQFTKGERKPPKKNKIRKFRVSAWIQKLLEQLYLNASDTNNEALIFTNNGNPIHLDNFREDVWKPALERASVPYRPPKNCRHTFVSQMLERGINPVLVAKITGHDTAVMFRNYAGLLSEASIPESD